MRSAIIFLLLFSVVFTQAQKQDTSFTTLFESSKGTETPEYRQVIDYYHKLAGAFEEISITEEGNTDSGNPLHLVTYTPSTLRVEAPLVLLINNGIHPGEPDGIDATMMLFRDLATGKINAPKNTIVAAIPVYNIGGALNRNSTSRTNQNGPEAYGFRGNARNFDLNRDFIKSDTRNAKTFAQIFQKLNPDVFIDNHVSNGADYQYTLTHLFTQHNKLGGVAGNYLHEVLRPELEKELENEHWDITPYVNVFNNVPEKGFSQFFDSPRYSTGYTTLWNTLGMMVETHMLKPYKPRVEGTYALMSAMLAIIDERHEEIKAVRTKRLEELYNAETYPLTWENDTTQHRILNFKGYEGKMIKSEVTGLQRLKYDRNQPFVKPVEYRDVFKPVKEVRIPEAYLLPVGWHNVTERLQANGIQMERLNRDTTLMVETYIIDNYDTRRSAYEGHYLHTNTSVKVNTLTKNISAGSYYLIPVKQPGIRYLLETLEPEAADSFFNWNFFDTILQQKEGFSPYVWEDKARELLETDPDLAKTFREKKAKEPEFANSWYAQLDWLHKNSENYEKAHLRYPVLRIVKP
ncbi:M14 family metallopeptidase [Robertkochia marina]|uniref:M14 family metallopeptidase n=1 Tax=Robertkochia marina TaxID=1227945 RepID=UPI001F553BDF|nr:M14 family metallopeptidase [Robertkochia marina]